MEQYYTSEKNVLIVIALLKAHGIKRVVASPGSTNVTFVGSIQQDPWFEIYSCVDERSAAYMACGLAAETQEPVVLSCTGATASRNYFSALTEAYYRKLPILAITSTQDVAKLGNLFCQVIDRQQQPHDTTVLSEHMQTVKDQADEADITLRTNKAILALRHHGGGPVHINLTTTYSKDFHIKQLPEVRKIERHAFGDRLPEVKAPRVAIFIGSHLPFAEDVTELIDRFCARFNGAVFCDTTANYHGRYRVDYSLASWQKVADANRKPELLIHLGEMSDQAGMAGSPREAWRVSEDGKLVDRYGALTHVFEMTERQFFAYYAGETTAKDAKTDYLDACLGVKWKYEQQIPELPFSHLWVAQQLSGRLPAGSCLHLGILSPLRSWSFWPIDPSIQIFCNQGGFGIDGNMSTLLGASLVHPDRLYFGVFGDLSFFYDMNSLGNRHKQPNLRILLINNSLGAEFHLTKQINCTYVNDIDKYLSAGGHFGHQSPDVVRHLAQDWGCEYLTASSKEEFARVYERFVTPELTDRPMVFEVFTEVGKEDEALVALSSITGSGNALVGKAKQKIKEQLGQEKINALKTLLKR